MMMEMLMQLPAGIEWVLIVLAAVIVFFGAKKMPELVRSFGRAQGEYEKARAEAKKEIDELKSRAKGDS